MATFDQLTAEQRAIIELVVRRGRSYESLADVLEISPTRVRDLARDALAELSPVTAERVDADWRAQLADYLLGQQSGPESTATRGHLKRSEAARAWALSVVDSLDGLYGNGSRPVIPDSEPGANGRARGAAAAAALEAERPRERDVAAERRRKRERDTERDSVREARREREPARPSRRERKRAEAAAAPLSPEGRAALRRRRIVGGAAALAIVAGVVIGILAATGTIFSSGHRKSTTAQRTQIVGLIPFAPVGNSGGQGYGVLAKRGSQYLLYVEAKLKPSAQGYAYEVWLYNSPNDVISLGAQVTDQQGNYAGQGPLPANYTKYKFIDISYEKIGASTAHNGPSVLRGAFASLQQPPASATQGAPGATTTPAPGATPTPAPGATTPAPGATPTPAPGATTTP